MSLLQTDLTTRLRRLKKLSSWMWRAVREIAVFKLPLAEHARLRAYGSKNQYTVRLYLPDSRVIFITPWHYSCIAMPHAQVSRGGLCPVQINWLDKIIFVE